MPNLLELVNNAPIIKERIKAIVEDLKADIDNGIILNETEVIIKLQKEVLNFANSIHNPSIVLHPMYKAPVSEDLNAMLYAALTDLSHLYSTANIINAVVNTVSSTVQTDSIFFSSTNKHIEKRIKDLQTMLDNMTTTRKWQTYVDTFVDYTSLDQNMVEQPLCTIDTLAGVLMLSRTAMYRYNDNISIGVDNNSNGFPGNTHQAAAVNGAITYIGETSSHTDLLSITDGNKDTWFEYEGIKVPQSDVDEVGGYGFKYKEGLSWLFNEDDLTLTLTINVGYNINWITLDTYLPPESGFIPSVITSIKIDNGKGQINELCPNPVSFKREMVYVFNKQFAKTITITFQQSNSYICQIGHDYYIQTGASTNFLEPADLDGIRMDVITHSSELIGIRYEPSSGLYTQPATGPMYTAPESYKLFELQNIDATIRHGTELLTGSRYQVGIRTIEVACIEFDTISEYISKEFKFEDGINLAQLDVNSFVPAAFGDGNWIVCKLSFDNGSTWQTVTPNTEVPIGKEVKSVRVGITMSRPEAVSDMQYLTPILYNYTLKGAKI